MQEQNMIEKTNDRILQEANIDKPNFVNQIDDIIAKYRNQLEQLKTNSKYSKEKSPNPVGNKIQSNSISSLMPPPPELNNEHIPSSANGRTHSRGLAEEIQNDNIKLQSALTSEKLNNMKLNSQIEKYELALQQSKQEIIKLQNQLSNKENELNDMVNQINGINSDIVNIRDSNNFNINIIQTFFDLFNKNLEIFNKARIIPEEKNIRIAYVYNDVGGHNQKLSMFVANSLDILINKLLQDNKELYEQLIRTKKVLDEQNNIQFDFEEIKKIQNENMALKQQIQALMKENEIFKKENDKLNDNIIDLNSYILNLNNLNTNYSSDGNKRERMNSHSHSNNTSSNSNKLKYFRNYFHNSARNIENNNNNTYDNINVKMTNNNNEDMNVNNTEGYNNYNYNYNYNYSNENVTEEKRNESGFERPIEQLKKKIMILEHQIKNTPQS